MQIFRVQSSSDAYYQFELQRHKLTTKSHLISLGAPDDYNEYVNTNVRVYVVQAGGNEIASLIADFQLNPPTKASFKKIGTGEIFI
ncbi:hypothetical protein OGY68_19730 [Citrobacter sp. Cpo065]|uniref:hypothetical protein n=1 Tax=Citrobacter sp. Cpo065 TaxID=2985131 RepID=UPI002575D715|nr:hypothetical protein [Citrobacter sp. Cpo065]MDM2855123.1 hypothetical protein [Citrobacter sp. Cpo065]